MKWFLILLVVCKFSIPIESFNLSDIGKSATDVAKGVIDKIPDAIPSPEDIFQAGKNLIAGYPFEQVCLFDFFFYFPMFRNAVTCSTLFFMPFTYGKNFLFISCATDFFGYQPIL